MLIGKLVGDFLLVIIERFSLGAFVVTIHAFDRQTDGQQYRAYASLSHSKNKTAKMRAYLKFSVGLSFA